MSSYLNVELRCKWSFFFYFKQNLFSPSNCGSSQAIKCWSVDKMWASCPVLRLSELNLSKIYRQLLKFCDTSRLCRILYSRVGIYRWHLDISYSHFFTDGMGMIQNWTTPTIFLFYSFLRILFLTQALVRSLVVHLWHREYSLQNDLLSCEGLPDFHSQFLVWVRRRPRNYLPWHVFSRLHKSVHCS